jgi:hypothetical protein
VNKCSSTCYLLGLVIDVPFVVNSIN